MRTHVLQRYGILLDTLAQITDVERQVVQQGAQPGAFVPDQLLEQWTLTFQGGRGFFESGLDEEIVSVLVDFDYFLDNMIGFLPTTALNKEAYIRYDEGWQEIREMADWTLKRIAFLQMPGEVEFDLN
ncbi:MAG: hypothetical protein GYB64_09230 [Chloroflexi bacterium]|nr:hypothetical protein [Chloroflexota bacterium]